MKQFSAGTGFQFTAVARRTQTFRGQSLGTGSVDFFYDTGFHIVAEVADK